MAQSPDLPLRLGGEEVVTGSWIEVHAPYDGRLLGRVARAGPAEVERSIASAASGSGAARKIPAFRRAEILRAIAGQVRSDRARYVEGEVDRALTTLALSAEESTRIPGEVLPVDIEPRGEGAFCAIRRFPV